MLNDMVDSSVRISLRMNLEKTTIMFNEHILPKPVAVLGAVFKVVQKYVYVMTYESKTMTGDLVLEWRPHLGKRIVGP